MTFRQAGILTSKALGVFCAVAFIREVSAFPAFLQLVYFPFGDTRGNVAIVVIVAVCAFLLYLSTTLWFAAGRFVQDEPGSETSSIQVADLQRLTFRAIGLYLLATGLASILARLGFTIFARRAGLSALPPTAIAALIEGALYCTIGGLLYFSSFKGMPAAPGNFIQRYFGWFLSPFDASDHIGESSGTGNDIADL